MLRSKRGRLELRRRVVTRSDGLIGLEQEYFGTDIRTVVTQDFLLVTRIEVQRGALSFPLAAGEVMAPKHFLLLIPPRTVLPMKFDDAHVLSSGAARPDTAWGSASALLPTTGAARTIDAATVPAILASPNHVTLEPDGGVPEYARIARVFLHENLSARAPISRAARQAGVRPETLTRTFQAAYHLSPKAYSNKARLFQSVLRLLDGGKISETAFSSGFGDLKRFYAQFSRMIGSTPGEYARVRKRQDKQARR